MNRQAITFSACQWIYSIKSGKKTQINSLLQLQLFSPFMYLLQFLNAGRIGPLWMFITLQSGLHSREYPPLLRLPPGLRLLLLRFLEGLHIDRHYGHGVVELLAVSEPGVWLLQKYGIHFNTMYIDQLEVLKGQQDD